MNIINSIIRFFAEGGFWMYPILAVGAIGIAITVERLIKLSLVERANRKTWDDLHPVMAEGNFQQAREMAVENKSAVGDLVQRLEARGARLYVPRSDWDYAVGAGLRMLVQRHLVDVDDGLYRGRASETALLRYYANSIAHLLPD